MDGRFCEQAEFAKPVVPFQCHLHRWHISGRSEDCSINTGRPQKMRRHRDHLALKGEEPAKDPAHMMSENQVESVINNAKRQLHNLSEFHSCTCLQVLQARHANSQPYQCA